MRNFITFLLLIFAGSLSFAQITLNNPSFEDEPSDATVPMGWFPSTKGTTPDIVPGPWGVDIEAAEGDTYVGLITRIDGSFEAIGQRISEPLVKGKCYSFTLSAAACDTYSGFNSKIQFRVWGGNKKNKRTQLLYQSELVDYDEWQEHKVDFTPIKNLKYIIIEAYHSEDKLPVKGHVLIDNISSILKCNKV